MISVAQPCSAASGPDAPDAAATEEGGVAGQKDEGIASLRTGLEAWLAALVVSGSQEGESFDSGSSEDSSSLSKPEPRHQADGAQRQAAAVLLSSDNLLMQAAGWVVQAPQAQEEEGQVRLRPLRNLPSVHHLL